MTRACLLCGLLLLVSGCGGLSTVPSAAAPTRAATVTADQHAEPTTALRAQGILAAMSAYETVIRDGDTAPIDALTDSAPVRRFLSAAAAAAPPLSGADHRTYRVTAIGEPLPGVLEAELAGEDGHAQRFLFRQQGERWVLTEATEAELGERVQVERGAITIQSFANYAHTEAAVAAVDAAIAQVRQFFGALPDTPLRIVLKPAFGVGAIIPFDVQGQYLPGRRPSLTVAVPWAVNTRPYGPELGWQGQLQQLVAHELTHYVHQQSPALQAVNKAPAWVAEGLAEYVAAPLRLDLAREFDAADAWLPLGEADGRSLLRLEALSPQDRAVAYVQAQLLVAYLAREDRAALWDFFETYAATPGVAAERLERALQQRLGVDAVTFSADWRAWVQTQLDAAPAP
jgi:hypothetical protein